MINYWLHIVTMFAWKNVKQFPTSPDPAGGLNTSEPGQSLRRRSANLADKAWAYRDVFWAGAGSVVNHHLVKRCEPRCDWTRMFFQIVDVYFKFTFCDLVLVILKPPAKILFMVISEISIINNKRTAAKQQQQKWSLQNDPWSLVHFILER